MKKLLLTLSLFPVCALAATDATVVASGNWSAGTTWEGGVKPAAAGDNLYNITFGANDLSLQMHTGSGYTASGTVNVYFADGVTSATILNSNTSNECRMTIDVSKLTAGNLTFGDATGHTNKVLLKGSVANGVNITLNTNLIVTEGWDCSGFMGSLTVNAGTEAAPVKIVRLSGRGDLTLKSGSYMTTANSNAMNFQDNDTNSSLVTIESGATLKLGGGIKFYDADISGNLIVNGARPYKTSSDSINFFVQRKVIFREGSTLVNTYATATGARPVISGGGIMYSYAGERALASAQALQLTSGGTLVLNSKNALAIGGKNEQNILVSGYVMTKEEAGNIGDSKTTGNLKIGVDEATGNAIAVEKNTIDNLTLYADSTINLWLNGNELEIVNLLQTGDTTNKFNVMICDDIIKGDLVIQNFNGLTSVNDIKAYISKSSDLAEKELFVENVNNSIYIYTTVPEPSTYAMIFGAIALGFVAYRRAKARGRA